MGSAARRAYGTRMTTGNPSWVVVADGELARLLGASTTQHGKVHLDEVARLASSFVAGDHERPTRMGQPGHGGASGNEPERKLAHFAKQLAAWIGQELAARQVARCALFAPSHLLGALRAALPGPLAGKLVLQTGELAQFAVADLARHPGITALLAK